MTSLVTRRDLFLGGGAALLVASGCWRAAQRRSSLLYDPTLVPHRLAQHLAELHVLTPRPSAGDFGRWGMTLSVELENGHGRLLGLTSPAAFVILQHFAHRSGMTVVARGCDPDDPRALDGPKGLVNPADPVESLHRQMARSLSTASPMICWMFEQPNSQKRAA